MKLAMFYTKPYETPAFEAANTSHGHRITYFEEALHTVTAPLAAGHDAVVTFVNDTVDAPTIKILAGLGIRLVLCRSAGFNQVDLRAASRHGMTVMYVPAYSPESIAEFTVGLILCLNRQIHHAYNRVRESNFSIDNLTGFTLKDRTVGIIGTGKVGVAVARILRGFGCVLLGADPYPSEPAKALGVTYVERSALLAQADIVILTCPLTPDTRHLINPQSLRTMKRGSMLINTGRGALIDTAAMLDALKSQETVCYFGADVYEYEAGVFFEDRSAEILQDDVLQLLLSRRNALVTPHMAWLTRESLHEIAETTLGNASAFEAGHPDRGHVVTLPD